MPSTRRRSRRRPGRIKALNLPGGVGIRVDTAAYQDGVIPPYYDSLVAKLVAYGGDRAEAIARMQRALDLFIVEGVHTSIPLHQRILADPEFQSRADRHAVRAPVLRTREGRGDDPGGGLARL